jgi:hypothetical protein
MKKHKIILSALPLIGLFLIMGYYLLPYFTLEGKYKIKGSNSFCEFKDGYYIANGEKAKYSIYFRTVYIDVDIEIHEDEEAGIKGSKRTEKFPVYIYWDHLEMPNIKGGRIILEPINED